jgi:hypothetical protein
MSPFMSPWPGFWLCRAKERRNHNPRVGGSSPSSGIPVQSQTPLCRANTRGCALRRSDRSERLRTPRGRALMSPHIAPGGPVSFADDPGAESGELAKAEHAERLRRGRTTSRGVPRRERTLQLRAVLARPAMAPGQSPQRVAEARDQEPKRGALVARRGQEGRLHLRERASAGRTFESIGDEWIAGVAIGRIGRRKERSRRIISHCRLAGSATPAP